MPETLLTFHIDLFSGTLKLINMVYLYVNQSLCYYTLSLNYFFLIFAKGSQKFFACKYVEMMINSIKLKKKVHVEKHCFSLRSQSRSSKGK